MCVSESDASTGYLLVSVPPATSGGDGADAKPPKSGGWKIIAYDWQSETQTQTIMEGGGVCSGMSIRAMPADHGSARGSCIIAAVQHKTLRIFHTASNTTSKYTHARELTAVAIHPSEPYVATGDCEGQITLWYCLSMDALCSKRSAAKSPRVVTSTMHWHAHAVACLAFSADGAVMLSGGEENVLVLWQLDTGHRTFLPRMGAPLCTIMVSPSSDYFAVTCEDNSVRLISAMSLEEVWRSQGLALAHEFKKEDLSSALLTGLSFEPRRQLLVLNGKDGSGSLQFFDVKAKSHAAELRVMQRNQVSRANKQKVAPFRVEHVCFSGDGLHMATVDTNRAHTGEYMATSRESCSLKFWSYDRLKSQYILSSQVDSPHQGGISSLVYNPVHHLVVSASADHTCKVWEGSANDGAAQPVRMSGAKADTSMVWRCRSVCTYRQQPVCTAAFSLDGSLLAAAYGNVLTLWDPFANKLYSTLVHPPPTECIRKIHFIPGSSHLVSVTNHAVYVWDLLSCSICWSYEASVLASTCSIVSPKLSSMGADVSEQSRFAIAIHTPAETGVDSDSSLVILFDSHSPIPLHIWKTPEVFEMAMQSQVGAVSKMVCLSTSRELFQVSQAEALDGGAEDVVEKSGDATAFSRAYGIVKEEVDKVNTTAMSTDDAASIFDLPSHAIPRISVFYQQYMAIMTKKVDVPKSVSSSPDFLFSNHEAKKIMPSQAHHDEFLADEDNFDSMLGFFQEGFGPQSKRKKVR
jgi:NET1-associated nuclear protein 1 (U3 small nucleolar RNA-associated protein 17)